jgi:hypothetical protein
MSQAIRSGRAGADALMRANHALREAWRQFDSPVARRLPPAEYSALERRVLHLTRLVEGLLLGPRERWGNDGGTHHGAYARAELDPAAPSRN